MRARYRRRIKFINLDDHPGRSAGAGGTSRCGSTSCSSTPVGDTPA